MTSQYKWQLLVKNVFFMPLLLLMASITCIPASYAAQQKQDIYDGSSSVVFHGQFIQGALIRGMVPKKTQVLFNGKPIRVSPQGFFVIGFDRDAVSPQLIKFHYPDGRIEEKSLKIDQQKYRIQDIKGIAKKIMQPTTEDIVRAKKEGAAVWQARNTNSSLLAFSDNFIWPLTGKITGVFGSQRIYNGVPSRPHFGVDVAAPTGTKVVAPADGVITLSYPDMFYSGGTMIIDHGYGVSSSFLHLSKLLVKVGDKVKQGQYVAEVGASGRATGPHLDWRINWYQMRLDPTTIVPPMALVLKNQQ